MNRAVSKRYYDLLELSRELIDGHPDDFRGGLLFLNGSEMESSHFPPFNGGTAVIIDMEDTLIDNVQLSRFLTRKYTQDQLLWVLQNEQGLKTKVKSCTINQLVKLPSGVQVIILPARKVKSSLEDFMETITHLRAPDGCPWDKKQDHKSLRPYLLEETYEALETLDKENYDGLREELGDLLLQIALHAVIAEESGNFKMDDVIKGINSKIISRHPHVFGELELEGEADVLRNWEKLKAREREENGSEDSKGILDGIPATLPALTQAQTIQLRAARVGFDWPEIVPVIDKIFEELEEVKAASNKNEQEEELGDLLFAIVNLVRWYGIDAESALRRTNEKFRDRFAFIEKEAANAGKELQKMTLPEMDELWEKAKAFFGKSNPGIPTGL